MNDDKFRSWNRPTFNQHTHNKNNFEEINKSNEKITLPKSSKIDKHVIPEVNMNEKRNIMNKDIQNSRLEESKTNPKVMYKVDEFGIPIEEIKLPHTSNSTGSIGIDTPISTPIFDNINKSNRPPPLR